jgi:hypothetical protein
VIAVLKAPPLITLARITFFHPYLTSILHEPKKKKRLQPWDSCKRLKFGGHLPHPGSRLTPFSGINHLVSRCPTLSIATTAPESGVRRVNARNLIKSGVLAFLDIFEREFNRAV